MHLSKHPSCLPSSHFKPSAASFTVSNGADGLGSRSKKPFDIAVTPNGRKLYVLNSGGDTVTILPRNFKQSAFSGEFRSQLTPYARGFHDRDRRETLIGDSVAERNGFELSYMDPAPVASRSID